MFAPFSRLIPVSKKSRLNLGHLPNWDLCILWLQSMQPRGNQNLVCEWDISWIKKYILHSCSRKLHSNSHLSPWWFLTSMFCYGGCTPSRFPRSQPTFSDWFRVELRKEIGRTNLECWWKKTLLYRNVFRFFNAGGAPGICDDYPGASLDLWFAAGLESFGCWIMFFIRVVERLIDKSRPTWHPELSKALWD